MPMLMRKLNVNQIFIVYFVINLVFYSTCNIISCKTRLVKNSFIKSVAKCLTYVKIKTITLIQVLRCKRFHIELKSWFKICNHNFMLKKLKTNPNSFYVV